MWSRRDVIRLGMIGGGAALIPSHHAFAAIPSSFWDDPKSPPTTPFIQPLPVPPGVQRVRPFVPDARCAAELAALPAEAVARTRIHQLIVEERHIALHPELPPSRVWRYRDALASPTSGVACGPTFQGRMGDPCIVRFINRLPPDHAGFGVTELTTHLHGGHIPAASDGFPGPIAEPLPFNPLFAPPGHPHLPDHYDYCYPMLDVGFSTGEPDPSERPSTIWYHDHSLDYTGPNVLRGLAGFYLVFDEKDSGDETDTTPGALRLPSGAFDVPLVLADRLIAPDGSLLYLPGQFDGFLGDKFLVNGAVQPYLQVKARKYRFRVLNGSNARMYRVAVVTASGQVVPYDIIATEGGLLSGPLRDQTSVMLSMSHRRELVLDFSGFPPGTVLYLIDLLGQEDGRGPKGKFEDEDYAEQPTRLMKFIVGEAVPDPSQVPSELRPFAPISSGVLATAKRRQFEFERRHGVWVINGEPVDLDRIVARPKVGDHEIWRFVNKSGGWWHPIHVHLEFARIISRDGGVPPLERDGVARADSILLGPNSEVEAFYRFRDFPGAWVFHCHNIEHEDHFMMARWQLEAE